MRFRSPYTTVLVILTASLALMAAKCDENAVSLTMLCDGGRPNTTLPNGVSFIFKAEDANGEPITDLHLHENDFIISDGGVTSGGESQPQAIQRPQNVASRTLILIDGSGSIFQSGAEGQIKAAVRQFLTGCTNPNEQGICTDENGNPLYGNNDPVNDYRRIVGIYKFYGGQTIEAVYGFSQQRDQDLSLSTQGTEEALRTAWNSDRAAMLNALEADAIAREQTSTALHNSTKLALDELQAQPRWLPTDNTRPAVVIRSMVLFTDGRDEVNAGSNYELSKTDALERAKLFKTTSDGDSNPNQSIFVAGVRGANNGLDSDFLKKLASSGGYNEVQNFSNLTESFKAFSEKSARAVMKYYQFNLCTNRRGNVVDATLITPYPEHVEGSLDFSYDATQFSDPSPGYSCDVQQLQTCQWSDNNAAVTTPGSGDPSDPYAWRAVSRVVESTHPYSSNSNQIFEIRHPGARYIRVHFDRIETEPVYDYVTVLTPSSGFVNEYNGLHTNVTTNYVSGDTILVLLESDSDINSYGFRISRIEVIE